MEPDRWRAAACAKLNLGLSVGRRRPDGYHEIRTTLQSIALHDTIRVRRRPGRFRLTASSEEVPRGPDNLVWQAADSVWRELGRSGPVRDAEVAIEKRIPVRAGLGGGSADAATALALLGQAWAGGLSTDRLARLAAGIGADVPFFLHGGRAVGTGRGDLLEPLQDGPARWVVLIVPPFGVSTVDAYRWFDDWVAAGDRPAAHSARADLAGPLVNDLEAPVAARHSAIVEIRRRLEAVGADAASMSGSGSAVFGLFAAEATARDGCSRLRAAGWRASVTRTLSRREHATRTAPTADRRPGV